jgi:hypothetical protein
MLCRPFKHESQGSVRQLALDDFQCTDIYLGFLLSIECMEMRRSMISPKHLNHDSVKGADGRQLAPPWKLYKPEPHILKTISFSYLPVKMCELAFRRDPLDTTAQHRSGCSQ